MSIGDAFSSAAKEALFQNALAKGEVFLNKFPEIDHPKFFIVVGLSDDKLYTCSVYINSEIHPSIKAKQELYNLQVPIQKANNGFLSHDSYACCSTLLPIESNKINEWKNSGSCKVIGQVSEQDLEIITNTILDSNLLTAEEIEQYFQIK